MSDSKGSVAVLGQQRKRPLSILNGLAAGKQRIAA